MKKWVVKLVVNRTHACVVEAETREEAIVKAVTHFDDPYILAEVSRNLGDPMVGRQVSAIPDAELIADRGW